MGHDASVSILKDGRPVFCVSEERIAREKMYWGFPFQALEAALNNLGLSPDQLEAVAFDTLTLAQLSGPEKMARRFSRGAARSRNQQIEKVKRVLKYLLGAPSFDARASREAEARNTFWRSLRRIGLPLDRVRVYDHHLCHAASAFWPSPFPAAVYVTSDARGDGKSATLGVASGWNLKCQQVVRDLDSLGQFYSAVTAFLGFRANRHEGKVMGLAAHGDPFRLGPAFLENVTWSKDGAYTFRLGERYRLDCESDLGRFIRGAGLSLKEKVILHTGEEPDSLLYHGNWFGQLLYLRDVASQAAPEDVAAGVQWLIETVCPEFIKRNLPLDPTPVALAGGLFSNVRLNQKIRELVPVSSVFVQPAMGDDGLSLGAALLAHADTMPQRKQLPAGTRPSWTGHTYLGPRYSRSEILEACRSERVFVEETKDTSRTVAEFIRQGLIVGYFRQRMEYGPRALGHRSILAKPDDQQLNQQLNTRLHRTEFMPFAPSLLAELAPDYLVGLDAGSVDAEFMTSTYQVPPNRRRSIAAAVHVDGTVRPQVVRPDREPEFHGVLREYFKLSGIPAVINTSFNSHEEPIVCAPRDAIRDLKRGCVDILVMENYVVRTRQPYGLSKSERPNFTCI